MIERAHRSLARRHARIAAAAFLSLALLGAVVLAATGTFAGARARAHGAMAGMNMSAAETPAQGRRSGPCTSSACPIPAPGPDELSVAGELGSALAAVWISPAPGGAQARLELLDSTMAPARTGVRVRGSSGLRACGPGCWTFRLPGHPHTLSLSARQHGHYYALSLPVSWQRGQSARARRLLDRALTSMRSLRGVAVHETLTSGPPHPLEQIDYRFAAPDRMSYTVDTGARMTVIGATAWSQNPGQRWHESSYGAGAFSTSGWYDWQEYAQSAQLLEVTDEDGSAAAEVALMSRSLPVWFRLRIDIPSGRVSRVEMTAGGHFMTDSYSRYGAPQRILAPR